MRFPQAARLKHSTDIKHVLATKKKHVSRFFVFFVSKRTPEQPARIGLIVTKRLFPLSVSRNRIKRQLREVFRHRKHLFRGHDIVVLARKSLTNKPNAELHQCIQKEWEQLALSLSE